MLLFAIIITQVITIPIASHHLSTILPSGANAFLISLSAILLYGFSIQILGGLFQTPLFKIPIMFPLCISEGDGWFFFNR